MWSCKKLYRLKGTSIVIVIIIIIIIIIVVFVLSIIILCDLLTVSCHGNLVLLN